LKAYTGVGSRETPEDMQELMKALAGKLADKEYILRSGAAPGADRAFELGWLGWYFKQTPWPRGENCRAEIYVPWSGFEHHNRDGLFGATIVPSDIHFSVWDKAEKIAMETHPAWDKCSQGAQKLHTRNVFQVLGRDLQSPSKFLVCWAKIGRNGTISGGTATAWNLAKANNIPCFNLNDEADYTRIQKFMES
jgi:hypothetical protein